MSAESKPAGARPRLVSAEEGEAIVQAAWELRHGLIPKPDCSHFVHAVYAQAGYLYEYAASREVFAGVEGFRRVKKPQPGDVVVWLGHIGIVIDPREHSFYSSVLSGFAIENYQSTYWIRHGNPRFYRFLVNNSAGAPRPVPSSPVQARPASDQVLLRPMQPSPASTQPPALMVAGLREGSGRQSAHVQASAQVRAVASPQVTAQASPAQIKAEAVPARDAEIQHEALVTSRATPSRREVLAAIIRSADDNGERLLRNRLLDWQPSVGVVDHFRIVSLDFQDSVGLAEVEVKEIAAFRYGTAKPFRLTARQRVILSRQKQGWILLDPQDLVFLNRHVAARALSTQLATMSQSPTGQQEVRRAVKILHELLSEKSAGAGAAGSN